MRSGRVQLVAAAATLAGMVATPFTSRGGMGRRLLSSVVRVVAAVGAAAMLPVAVVATARLVGQRT